MNTNLFLFETYIKLFNVLEYLNLIGSFDVLAIIKHMIVSFDWSVPTLAKFALEHIVFTMSDF